MVLLHIFLKGLQLRIEAHDPAVGHSAQHGNAEKLSCFHIGSAVEAADHGSPGAPESCRMALGPSQAEFHERILRRHGTHPAALGGNQTFMVHNHGKSCLQQHGLGGGPFKPEKQFSRESYRAFRHGINISGEMEMGKIIQKFRIENMKVPEIFYILIAVGKILYKIHQMGQSCHHGIAALEGIHPIKTVKYDFSFMHALLEKSIGHRELIQISDKSIGCHNIPLCIPIVMTIGRLKPL